MIIYRPEKLTGYLISLIGFKGPVSRFIMELTGQLLSCANIGKI
jgi:hypothetical protein